MKYVRWAVMLLCVVPVTMGLTSCTLLSETVTITGSGGPTVNGSTTSFFANSTYVGSIVNLQHVRFWLVDTHTRAADVGVELKAQSGLTVTLFSPGSAGASDSLDNSDIYTFVDDDDASGSAFPVTFTNIVVPTTYRSAGNLDVFDDQPASGMWELRVFDSATGADICTLGGWQLTFSYEEY